MAGPAVVIAALAAVLGDGLPASSPPPAASPVEAGDPVPAPRRSLVTVRGVAGLDPALVRALRRAATDAADHGVGFHVKSGRRSPEHQEQLLREAVSRYGSVEEAARWVASPETSAHVSGDAVDLGPDAAAAWLSDHGAAYGLCQIYGNEPWHYELRPGAREHGCPRKYPDPTHDPRMRHE